jgi:hypothetical protein
MSVDIHTITSILEMGTRIPPAPGQYEYSVVWRRLVYRSDIGCGAKYTCNIALEDWCTK